MQRVAEGVSMLAAAFAPYPVIVRMSDFKSNEYANLLAGPAYEPDEENPMIGYRGASRYLSEEFVDCFAMECEALRHVRDDMGLTNVWVMIPFVRTARGGQRRDHAAGGARAGARQERPQGRDDVRDPVERRDRGPVPGALRRLLDRLQRHDPADPGHRPRLGLVAGGFDERDPAVLHMLELAIKACKKADKYVGICGQGPSDHPDLAEWLLEQGIESMSLNPDTVVDTWLRLAGQKVD